MKLQNVEITLFYQRFTLCKGEPCRSDSDSYLQTISDSGRPLHQTTASRVLGLAPVQSKVCVFLFPAALCVFVWLRGGGWEGKRHKVRRWFLFSTLFLFFIHCLITKHYKDHESKKSPKCYETNLAQTQTTRTLGNRTRLVMSGLSFSV